MTPVGSPPWSRASAPIWAHVSGYAPTVRVDKPLAFLHAYIDDSASDKGDRRLFMAGYLNRAEALALFSEAWHEELLAAPSIDYLKMAEANRLRGQFDRWKGWTEQKRDEKLRRLANVIRHFKPMSFEISISLERFYHLVKPFSPRGLGNPHFRCCFGIVAGLAQYVDGLKIKTPIDFIFDQQEGVDADIGLFFDYMIRILPNDARRLISGPPIFRNEKHSQFLPLQAADMLAWHVRREHEACTPPERLAMANLLRSDGHLPYEIDEAMMKRWSDHHRSLLGISQLQSKGQWQSVRREIAHLSSLGIDPSTIGRRKNIYQRAREYVARLFRI